MEMNSRHTISEREPCWSTVARELDRTFPRLLEYWVVQTQVQPVAKKETFRL